jgi:hypothetical protein
MSSFCQFSYSGSHVFSHEFYWPHTHSTIFISLLNTKGQV